MRTSMMPGYLSKPNTSVVEHHSWPTEDVTVMLMSAAAAGNKDTTVNSIAQKLINSSLHQFMGKPVYNEIIYLYLLIIILILLFVLRSDRNSHHLFPQD